MRDERSAVTGGSPKEDLELLAQPLTPSLMMSLRRDSKQNNLFLKGGHHDKMCTPSICYNWWQNQQAISKEFQKKFDRKNTKSDLAPNGVMSDDVSGCYFVIRGPTCHDRVRK